MKVEIPAVDRLIRLGLTTYEAKAYLALTRRGSFSAGEAARLARIPRQRIYDVLSSLVERGLATTRPGNPVQYAAVAPGPAIQRLLANRRDELTRLERDAETMIGELTDSYREGQTHTDPLDYIEVLRDPRAIAERFDELQAAVEREILIFTRPPYARPLAQNVEGLRLLKRYTSRAVYELSLFDDPAQIEAVQGFIDAGIQARFVPTLPLKLVIVDEAIVVFGMDDPLAGESDLTMVVIEHPSLAGVLKLAFTSVWEGGLTFEEACAHLAGRGAEAAAS